MRKMKLVLVTIMMAVFLAGCIEGSADARKTNTQAQRSNMERANEAVPVPVISNFLAREAVAKQVRRLDERGKLFYVYIRARDGQLMGYYVSNTRPVSVSALLTPPDEVWTGGDGRSQVISTPGLGGTYGLGTGGVFFFDAETDAYIELSSHTEYQLSDQPLSLDVEHIRVGTVQ